jgi:hypothetical protein
MEEFIDVSEVLSASIIRAFALCGQSVAQKFITKLKRTGDLTGMGRLTARQDRADCRIKLIQNNI